MADFVDVICERWWQDTRPPRPGHHIGKDLSVVKRLMGQGWKRDELLGALGEYDGAPATLLLVYARGRRNLINQLHAHWLEKQTVNKTSIKRILEGLYKEAR